MNLIKLNKISNLQNGFAFKSKDYVEKSNTINFRMSQIRPGGKVDLTHNPKYLPDEYAEKYEDYLLQEGDVVIAMTDMASDTKILGVPTIIKQKVENLLLNQRVGKLFDINTRIIEIPYLRYILTAPQIYSQYKKLGKGGVQINLGKSDILGVEIPIYSLLEQKAIVAKIEQLFSELDNGIANLKTASAKLKIYRQAVLKKAFEGELTKEWREKQTNLPTADELLEQIQKEREVHYKQELEEWKQAIKEWEENGEQGVKPKKPQPYKPMIDEDNETNALNTVLPENWAYHKLGEIYEVYIGSTPSRKISSYWNGNINWVSSGEVAFRTIVKTEETITQAGLDSASTNVHPIGTVMLAMIGEGKTRGQAAILDIEACHNQNTSALRVNQNYLSSKLLYNFFYYTYQETRRIGSGNNQKALNKNRISNMLMPLMSFEEQKEIVQEIESRLSVCDKIEENIETSLVKSEALRQSILKKAFEGKLLSEQELENIKKYPEYESAEELLKRIKKERNK